MADRRRGAPPDPPEEDPHAEIGWTGQDVEEEFPELRLLFIAVSARALRRSPRVVRQQLRDLAGRFRGSSAINVRQAPVPGAYRIFFRHIGLDPDATRTPIEEAILERMLRGDFPSRNLLADARKIALVETGVAVWAIDADTVDGPLGIRLAVEGDRLGRASDAPSAPEGRLVIADAAGPLALLFGDPPAPHEVTSRTEHLLLFSIQVAGVPTIFVEEALHECAQLVHER
jgi:DNA/RNA-binding domain of Phe-tRNA-synthetase-like protein